MSRDKRKDCLILGCAPPTKFGLCAKAALQKTACLGPRCFVGCLIQLGVRPSLFPHSQFIIGKFQQALIMFLTSRSMSAHTDPASSLTNSKSIQGTLLQLGIHPNLITPLPDFNKLHSKTWILDKI